MSETKRVIDIKKEKLAFAIEHNFHPTKIKRLKEDIERHEHWERRRRRTKRNMKKRGYKFIQLEGGQ